MKKSNKKWIAFDFGPEKKQESNNAVLKDDCFQIPGIKNTFNLIKKVEPKIPADLAVHSKKVKEVEEWLQKNVVYCQNTEYSRMLLLTGPSGCGKTTTVHVLCNSMKIQVSEWVNPVDQDFEFTRNTGQTSRFAEFLSESKYPTLLDTCCKKVVLVEDFPNLFIYNASEFVSVLEKCYHNARMAIIFVCTDSSVGNLNLSQTLFPQDVRDKFKIHCISFNSCPPTLLKAALKRAQSLIRGNLDTFKLPSANVEEAIITSCMGDIRSAISQYNFAALKGTDDLPTEKTQDQQTTGTKRKRAPPKNSTVKHMARDETLGLFHSLGRVLNPKRRELRHSWRLQCEIDPLIDELSTQPATTGAFLFENYLKYFGSFDDVYKAAEILSDAQLFLEKWTEKHEMMLFGLYLVVFGLMVCNEHKVSKWNQLRGPTKLKKVLNDNPEMQSLSSVDYYYYNIITKNNTLSRFKQKNV